MITAPFENRRAIDVPRKVEQDVALGHASREELVQVVSRDAILFVGDAEGEHVGHARPVVAEVDDADRLRVDLQISHQQRHGALGDGATAQYQHSLGDFGLCGGGGVHADAIGEESPASWALSNISR